MLTKKDLQLIGGIVQDKINKSVKSIVNKSIDVKVKPIIDKSMKAAFQDFYDSIFEPYVNKNEGKHEEMIKEIKLLRKGTNEITDYVKEHDKRIEDLENTASIRN